MKKIVIGFNGPPRSGKDTAQEMMREFLREREVPNLQRALGQSLKEKTHAFFDMPGVRYDKFEEDKDNVTGDFEHLTPRQAYIWMSEDVVKPKFGQRFWGERWVEAMSIALERERSWNDEYMEHNPMFLMLNDFGFVEEIEPIIEWVGVKNLHIVQLGRKGHDFSNDSRSYVSVKGAWNHTLENNGTIEEFNKKICALGEFILDEHTAVQQ